MVGDVWDEPRIVDFRHSPAQLGGGITVALVGIALLALAFRRYPDAFPLAALGVLPLRVPVEIGGETANLLVPLYLVTAAGALISILRPPSDLVLERGPGWPLWLRRVLAAALVLYAIQAAYSEDVSNAIENVGFFFVPFSILFVLLVERRWRRALLRRALIVVAAVAAVCALVGIYQYFARDLFFNPELFDANELHVYFRVNSLFYDPNILARYLALAVTALAACLAWGGTRRDLTLAAIASALCLVALAFSYSISGFAALVAGLACVAVLRWRWRGAVAAGAVGLAGLIALVLAGGTPTSDIEDYRSIDSGHADLAQGGLDLAQDRPIAGWGSGAFGRAFYERIEPARTTVSHSEPITVAAEQGAIGFALYLALLVTAFAVLLGGSPGSSLPRTAVAACFTAMVISSFGYTGFTTDPATWALLALGLAVRREPGSRRQAAPAAAADPPAASATIPG